MKAKKVMALMLCAAMVTSMSATAAFAAEEKEDAATEESQIPQQLRILPHSSTD